MLDGGVGKLGKKDVLRTLPVFSHDLHGAADVGLPKRKVKDVVQSKGNQGALGQTVDPGAEVPGVLDEFSDVGDTGLNRRPDKKHQNADQKIDRGRDDGDETGSAKEREHLRQLNLIIAVVQRGGSQPHNDTAEHPGLQR